MKTMLLTLLAAIALSACGREDSSDTMAGSKWIIYTDGGCITLAGLFMTKVGKTLQIYKEELNPDNSSKRCAATPYRLLTVENSDSDSITLDNGRVVTIAPYTFGNGDEGLLLNVL